MMGSFPMFADNEEKTKKYVNKDYVVCLEL